MVSDGTVSMSTERESWIIAQLFLFIFTGAPSASRDHNVLGSPLYKRTDEKSFFNSITSLKATPIYTVRTIYTFITTTLDKIANQ